jgi:O-antigen ligase
VHEDVQQRYARETHKVAAAWPWLVALGWAIDQPAAPVDDPIWGFALDDPLLSAWSAGAAGAQGAAPATPVPTWPPALALASALGAAVALAAWGVREGRRLPWRAWGAGLARQPMGVQMGVWVLALVGYSMAMWPPLVGLWLGMLALLALAQPRAALCLAAALLPFYFRHKEIPLPIGLTAAGRLTLAPHVAAALVMLPALLLEAGIRLRTLPRPRLRALLAALRWSDWLAGGWLLLALPAAFNVWHWGAYGQGVIEVVLAPLMLYASVRLFVRSSEQAMTLAVALAAGGLAVALIGLAQWLNGGGVAIDGVLRLVGPHYSPNHTALTLLRALFVGAGLLLAFAGGRRRVVALLLLPVAAALLLTASRGALLLGLPAGAITLLGFWALRSKGPLGHRLQPLLAQRRVQALLLVTLVMAGAALWAGEARLLNQASVDSRLLLWRAALETWRDAAPFGVGPGGFVWSYPAFLQPGAAVENNLLHPHNIWLEMATGWGVGGLIWLGALMGLWLLQSVRALPVVDRVQQGLLAGLGAALVAAVAHAQVDAFLALPDLSAWLFVALGVTAAALRSQANAPMFKADGSQ